MSSPSLRLGFAANSDEDSFSDESDEALSNAPLNKSEPVKKWDAFQVVPPDEDTGSAGSMQWMRRLEKLLTLTAYCVSFLVVMMGALTSKLTIFIVLAQLAPASNNTSVEFCAESTSIPEQLRTHLQVEFVDDNQLLREQLSWALVLFLCYAAPELGAFYRATRICLFKNPKWPRFPEFLFVLIMETCHASGMALLFFLVLPTLDTPSALALCSCLAVVPGLLLMMARTHNKWVFSIVDVIAVLTQLSGALFWPLMHYSNLQQWINVNTHWWALPLGLILASFGYWECFLDEHSPVGLIRLLWRIRRGLIDKSRFKVYLIVTPIKVLVFGSVAIVSLHLNKLLSDYGPLYDPIALLTQSRSFSVREGTHEEMEGVQVVRHHGLMTPEYLPLIVLIMHVLVSYLTYVVAKFACKVQIQSVGFALPLTLTTPVALMMTVLISAARVSDVCALHGLLPDHLSFRAPPINDFIVFLINDAMLVVYVAWMLGFMWISSHIWSPKSPRLATTEMIFSTPKYNALSIDQGLMLNRRRDGEDNPMLDMKSMQSMLEAKEIAAFYNSFADEGEKNEGIKASDRITRIYACATMWHETREEMFEMLKSVFRMDADYSARRLAQKYLQVVDPDYYEWETQILFDQAFTKEKEANDYVKCLVSLMDSAASHVHGKNMRVRPPTRYPTPYGGRLVWTLPGKTKMVVHLKDGDLIRHKKRWSQVMYMYYLLGFRLMELDISEERKELIAENSYLLALDGDIDFQPEAVTRLVDLMKKNKNLGAACGRIHPTGSGFMVWYQCFEYAIGHWLQKATEHVLGCVLCSPGCFSLFRATALMDDNVMCMYTTRSENPRDFVQYDQGEDRWLCTLLLQRGWRVEYSAASDAYTAAPEGFVEFFNQRRRWMPSTIANIMDVLSDYKNITKINNDISILYIIYQVMLMVGTILGPGTIFLMLVGAFTAAFQYSNWDSLLINLVPIALFMIVCFTMESKMQLLLAQVLSAMYALLMMAVLVGVALQVQEDGWMAPTSISFVLVFGSFFLAAVLHPQEFGCLPYLLVYYITIPAMYLLLVVYSIFNLNVVSWGTREDPKQKAEQEAKAREEAMKAEAEKQLNNSKKKSNNALLDLLISEERRRQAGGIDFGLANLFRCMCFTHDEDDEEKRQLSNIANNLNEVSKRLDRIESHTTSHVGNRRRSTFVHKSSSLLNVPNIESNNEYVEGSNVQLNAEALIEEQNEEFDDIMSDTSSSDSSVSRNHLMNPVWIDDKELGAGKVDFLPGAEIHFWNQLIEKYLQPVIKDVEKEKKQAAGLIELRNQMVFSFLMLNALFVLVIFVLQQQKENLYVEWPIGGKANITFIGDKKIPVVEVSYEYLQLEPLGLTFVIFFGAVLIAQMIGMLMHRWATLAQIVSTTPINLCKSKAQENEDEDKLKEDALAIARVLQTPKGNDEDAEEDKMHRRRSTVHALMAKQKERRAEESDNLEKRFRKRIKSIRFEEMPPSANSALRRLSAHPKVFGEFDRRRSSYFDGERRRSTLKSNLKYNVDNRSTHEEDTDGTDQLSQSQHTREIE